MANLRADNLTGTGGRNAITGSVFFPENSYLEVTTTSDLALGSGDFTIETWVNFTKIDTYQCIIDFRAAGNGAFPFIVRDTDGDLYYYINGSKLIDNIPARANNCWHHIAVVRNSGTTKFYLNGKEEGSASDSTTYVASNNPTIGVSTAESNDLFGYLSNLRIVKGTAVYTSAFTPPTEKLTAIEGTVLLCCQDSADPTQEATGKTINANGDILGRTETEYVVNGTFGGSVTSPGGSTYSPAWTAWGDTTTAQNGGIFIERTSTLTGVYQQLDQSIPVPGGQYRIRGIITNKTGPGSAIIRLSSASQGNGTIYFGAYGPGIIEHTFNYSGSGGLYMNLMLGNNTGSADFSNISFRNVVTGDTYNITPPVGVDEGVTFDGDTKHNTQSYMYFPTGDTSQRGRGRALIAGGTNGGGWGTKQNAISYIQIQSGGIAKDFGDLSSLRSNVTSVSSSTRAVFGGGSEGASANNAVNTIEHVTIATSSSVTNFGDLTSLRRPRGGVSNNTRGLFGGGYISPANKAEVDHVIIATTGDATDFGDLSVSGEPNQGSSNSTRGVWMGGGWGAQIEYVTIASTGSGADFGDIANNRTNASGASSSTRALCAGGGSADTDITFIQFATLSGDSDFGDLTQGRRILRGTSNGLRGIFCGGYTPDYNIIDYVDIATTGNAKDFGDLTTALREADACSDSYGGLS